MKDYLYLRAWCQMMGSLPYYVEAQLKQARTDKAPADAIYFSLDSNSWKRYDDVTNTLTRSAIDCIMKNRGWA